MNSFLNNMKQCHIGSFNSENFWRDESLAVLPAIPDEQANNIVLAMDELQFPLCKKDDVLITRYSMNAGHVEYLKAIGFVFLNNTVDLEKRNCVGRISKNKSIFELLTGDGNKEAMKGLLSECMHLSPFAVIPYTKEACSGFGMAMEAPTVDVVRKVNSKVYSTELKDRMNILNIGRIVSDSSEMYEYGMELIGKTKFIIKDEYGVAGKGNMTVESGAVLKRLVDYLKGQERNGRHTRFVMEPYLDKAIDFSSQFFIDQKGGFHLLSIQRIINSGFSYQGSFSADDELMGALGESGYVELLEKTAKELFKDGYLGHVCIDSMMLKNGNIEPVVEINARKSMSLIKHSIDKYLEAFSLVGNLTSINVAYNNGVEFEELLESMKDKKLLFLTGDRQGIIPLSANTLFINREADYSKNKKAYKGRLYFSAVSQDLKGIIDVTNKAKAFIKDRGFKVLI